MEPIQPEFFWRACQEIDTLPEAQLIQATISQAWEDAMKDTDCPIRKEARRWFFSEHFEHYCQLIDVTPYMRNIMSENWIFDKRINLSNVITGLTVSISIVWWAAQIEKRIAVLEVQFKAFYEMQMQLKSKK